MVNQKKKYSGKQKAGGVGVGIVAMLAVALPFTPVWEGRELKPYKDVVGVWTVCDGETNVPMRTYTPTECDQFLKEGLKTRGEKIAKLSPGIEDYPLQWAAHTSISYNIGVAGYAKSSMRRLYNQGKYRQACRFMLRYNRAGGKVWRGLQLRRAGDNTRMGEYELCLGDAIDAELEKQ